MTIERSVTSSLAAIQRTGHQADNSKMVNCSKGHVRYVSINMAPTLLGPSSILSCFICIEVSFGDLETKET